MEYQDYYETLGVPRTATQADIKKAFRKLARRAPSRRERRATRPPSSGSRSQRGERGPVRPGEAQALRPARRELGGQYAAGRGRRGAGARIRSGRAARSPGFAAGGGRAGRQRPLRVPDVERRRRRFSDFFRMFFSATRPGRRGDDRPRPRRGPTGGASLDDILAGHRGLGGAAPAASRPADRRDRGRARPARGPVAEVEAAAELTLEEAFHGTSRLVEVEGKRLEVHDPARASTPAAASGCRARARTAATSSSP